MLASITAYTNCSDFTFAQADLTKSFARTNWLNGGYQNITHPFYTFATNSRPYISNVTRCVLFEHKKYLVLYDHFETTQPAKFEWKWNCWSNATVNTNACSFVYFPTNKFKTNITVYVQHITDPTTMTLTNLASPLGHVYGTNLDNYAKVNPYTGENYNGAGDPQGNGSDSVRDYWQDTIWVENKSATTNWNFMTVVIPVKWGDPTPAITRVTDNTVHVQWGAIDDVISVNETSVSPATTVQLNLAFQTQNGTGGGGGGSGGGGGAPATGQINVLNAGAVKAGTVIILH